MTPESAGSRIYTDFSGLQKLKVSARAESPEAVKAVAKEFEASFVEMMLKSLRDASSGDGIMESDGSRMYQDMFDKQIAVDISERGDFGVAQVIEAQLTKTRSAHKTIDEAIIKGFGPSTQNPFNLSGLHNGKVVQAHSLIKTPAQNLNMPERRAVLVKPLIDLANTSEPARPVISDQPIVRKSAPINKQQLERMAFRSPQEFIETMRPHAERAAKEIGVDPELLIAQAALETGWGKKVIRNSDGTNSHNLFGIKASRAWDGDSVKVGSLEYRNGVAKKEVSAFRSYDSFTESFKDYVDFIKNQSRYDGAVKQAGNNRAYIKGLQTAGYATDPNYANKIMNILERKSLQPAWKGNA